MLHICYENVKYSYTDAVICFGHTIVVDKLWIIDPYIPQG